MAPPGNTTSNGKQTNGINGDEDCILTNDIVILDGGFSTQLSCHVNQPVDGDPLWSARFLATHPNEVIDTHLDFLRGSIKKICKINVVFYLHIYRSTLVDLTILFPLEI